MVHVWRKWQLFENLGPHSFDAVLPVVEVGVNLAIVLSNDRWRRRFFLDLSLQLLDQLLFLPLLFDNEKPFFFLFG